MSMNEDMTSRLKTVGRTCEMDWPVTGIWGRDQEKSRAEGGSNLERGDGATHCEGILLPCGWAGACETPGISIPPGKAPSRAAHPSKLFRVNAGVGGGLYMVSKQIPQLAHAQFSC